MVACEKTARKILVPVDMWDEVLRLCKSNPKEQIIHKAMERWCDCHHLPAERYKAEGSFPSGSVEVGNVKVWAFKAFQLRLYGVDWNDEGKRTFVVTEMDVKKRNKANKDKLKQAAKNFATLFA